MPKREYVGDEHGIRTKPIRQLSPTVACHMYCACFPVNLTWVQLIWPDGKQPLIVNRSGGYGSFYPKNLRSVRKLSQGSSQIFVIRN